MATFQMAAGSVLSTVQTTAETVSDIFSSVGTGARMINDFATNARERQILNIKVSKVGYTDQLMTQKTIEIDQSRQLLQDYIGNDKVKEERTKAIWDELKAALA